MVFRIAFGYTKNVHDADDIAQEVFLKLFKTDVEFASDENVKAWLIRVTINQSKSLLRSVWKTRRGDLTEFMAAEDSLSDDCYGLYEYVKDLKPKYRTIIYLYYYEQYSVKEIAEILKIRETTVTTQLSRARSQLKEILLEEGFV
jgi:RNA polymerase sigma-70 factor (ECF subfamily)